MPNDLRITKLTLMNYRSIRFGEFDLASPCILVGPNGAGKSNVIDALGFLADCVNMNPVEAVKFRGGLRAIVNADAGLDAMSSVGLRVEFRSRSDSTVCGCYALEVASNGDLPSHPHRREFSMFRGGVNESPFRSTSLAGLTCNWTGNSSQDFPPSSHNPRTWLEPLKTARTVSEFRQIALAGLSTQFNTFVSQQAEGKLKGNQTEWKHQLEQVDSAVSMLRRIRAHSPAPDQIKKVRSKGDGAQLERDGSNASSVLFSIQQRDHSAKQSVLEALQRIVPGLIDISARDNGGDHQTYFHFLSRAGGKPAPFSATQVSDGTVRALAILLALHQEPKPSLIAFEEPENSLHPAATRVILQSILSERETIPALISTHSPDFVESKELGPENFCVVTGGETGTELTTFSKPLSESLENHDIDLSDVIRQSLYADADGLPTGPRTPLLSAEEARARLFREME